MPSSKPDKQTELKWGKNPANYKLWGFYHNKEDKRFWIKNWDHIYRGKSFIINFAHPYALLFYIAFMLFLIIIIVALERFTGGTW